jgi:hypothetical protein
MIRTLRAFFLERALREKLLLLAFIGIAALWWGSAFAKRGAQFWREQRSTTAKLQEQHMWITNREVVEQRAQQTAAQLDPTRTLNANQLAAAVQQLAQEAGLRNSYRSGSTNTQTSGQFSIHSLDLTIQGADWEKQLTPFYVALQKRAPYIAIEQFTLQSAANNPAQLTLNLRVVSVEINR